MWSEQNPIILRFDEVSFAYGDGKHPILIESDFAVRQNTKITIMGQNGAGKTTIFKMITGELQPQKGKINIAKDTTIATARQVIPRDQLDLSIPEFFATAFTEKDYQLDKKIAEVLRAVSFNAPLNKPIREFSGGQQARLLLAYALIQHPDILLLDEPTNNLDGAGIGDLISFLLTYDKTVIVISHDADFLNLFTDWVLYLNKARCQVEQYRWDYYDVVEQIAAQIEREKMQNARAEKKIADAKDKVNFFSNKWGKMRKLASKLRDEIEEAEDNKVEVRKDDKTILPFKIEFENFVGPIVSIHKIGLMNSQHEVETHKLGLVIKKWQRYIFNGPNGIGKSTLLKKLMSGNNNDAQIHDWVRVGYYSQDFTALDMNMIVRDALVEVAGDTSDQDIYRAASHFLLNGGLLKNTIGSLSEWQKGLLCYARFLLQKPHLLIMDEPTNHINFRHLPVIAEALNNYDGALLIVCHDKGFVDQLTDLEDVNLGRLVK